MRKMEGFLLKGVDMILANNVHYLCPLLMDITNVHNNVHRRCNRLNECFVSSNFCNLVIKNSIYIRINGHGHVHSFYNIVYFLED